MNNVQSYNIALYITINTEFTRSLVPLVVQRYRGGGKRETFYRMIIGQELIYIVSIVLIERFHVTSSPSRLQRKTENSRKIYRCFYGDLHKMSDILTMLLICVESNKIPYQWVF